jgi:hypothetical protein
MFRLFWKRTKENSIMLSKHKPLNLWGLGRIISRAAALLLSVGLASAAYAQTATVGNISGIVRDSSGAVVPKAQVTVQQQETGLTRVVVSEDSGFFSAPTLPVGHYTVTAEGKGFKKTVETGLVLNVGEELSVNFALEVGEVSETVTVTGEAAQIDTRSGEVSALVDSTQVSQLPIVGRNYSSLVLLVPGISPDNRASSAASFQTRGVGLDGGVDISSNGNQSNENLWTVDGVNNMDVGSNRTLLVFPSIDSIQEFSVERNSFSAQYGQAQGAVINLITKGGSNQFHGTAWEFLRNTDLNANDFFLNANAQPKQIEQYNNFGGNFSGPIKKDRIFFFVSEEWRYEQRGTVLSANVPTAQERVGNFSGPLTETANGIPAIPHNPITGQPFPGNIIPSQDISPAGQAYLAVYPLPNTPNPTAFPNFVDSTTEPIRNRQDNFRGDIILNNKNSLMVRYIHEAWTHDNASNNFWGDSPIPTLQSNWSQPSHSFAVKFTTTLSATAVNEFQFSRAGNDINVTTASSSLAALTNFSTKFPTVFPNSIGGPQFPALWADAGYTTLEHEAPWSNHEDLFIWKDDFSWVKGAHTFKFGGLFSYNIKNEQDDGDNGIYTGQDSNNRTGNYLGDILFAGLPLEAYGEVSTNPLDTGRWRDEEGYVNDTWKVRSNFTLNLGLRYSVYGAAYSPNNTESNFLFSQYNGVNPLSGLAVAGVNGVSNSGNQNTYYKGLQPRFGIAWDLFGDGKTALRAGIGRFISRPNEAQYMDAMSANPPFATTIAQPWGGNATSLVGNPDLRTFDAIGSGLKTQTATASIFAIDPNSRPPESWQWNLTLSRELMRNTVLEVSYVGNHGLHLWRDDFPVNDILPQFQAQNALLLAQASTSETAFLTAHRLYPGLNPIAYDEYNGDSNYQALQVSFNRRVSQRLGFQASYSWSHCISDVPTASYTVNNVSDPFNANLDRGDCDLDRRQIFSANWVYNLPSLEHQFGNSFVGEVGQKVFGDWQLNGIFSYDGGPPVVNNVQTGANFAGTGEGLAQRPNQVLGACIYNCFPNDPTQWLNPAAFSAPGIGQYGTLGAGSIRLPSTSNVDFSIYKNFRVKERYTVQFRAEVFNLFNNVQFNGFTTSGAGSPLSLSMNNILPAFQTVAAGSKPIPYGAIQNGGFGVLNSDLGPRNIQFGLKFQF